jgi:Flp pilus assembly pilin Flp
MKNAIKRLKRDETGAAMVVALVLLLISGLVIGPLLSHMGSGLLVGEVYEVRTDELYAADAGMEDAVWKIQHPEEGGLPGCGYGWNYTYPEPGDPAFEVNDKDVEVTIQHQGAGSYKVISTSTSGDGSDTTITSYISLSYLDLSGILNYAISSEGAVNISGSDTLVDGDVYITDEGDVNDPNGAITGTIYDSDDVSITWPTFDQLHGYYWPDVMYLEPDPTDVILIPNWATTRDNAFPLGPYLADVEDLEYLEIKGGERWMRLDGTIYVKGNFYLDPSINLDLNGNAIFATGTIKLSSNSVLYGSGCIIATGDINFQPELSCEEGQYVLILSLDGTTTLQPDSDFQGTVAGDVEVQIQPGNELSWVSPYDRGLDFPMGEGEYPIIGELSIHSWEVSQQ